MKSQDIEQATLRFSNRILIKRVGNQDNSYWQYS